MRTDTVIAFAGLSVLLAMSPGPDTFLVLRHGVRRLGHAVAVAAGCASGSLFWALAASVGIVTLLARSATVFQVVRLAGGFYLVGMGVVALLRTGRSLAPQPGDRRGGLAAAFGSGLSSCLLNPKVGLFFLAVLPQFVGTDGGMPDALGLGLLDTVISFNWLVVVALASASAARWLRRPRVVRTVDRLSAAVLVGFGFVTIGGVANE